MVIEENPGTSRRNLLRGSAVVGGLALGSGLRSASASARPTSAGAVTPDIAAVSASYFLRIPGMKGDGTRKGYEDWIAVLNYGFLVTDTASPAKGGAKGKVSKKPLTVGKNIDPASVPLLGACSTGKRIPTARLDGVTNGGNISSNSRTRRSRCPTPRRWALDPTTQNPAARERVLALTRVGSCWRSDVSRSPARLRCRRS